MAVLTALRQTPGTLRRNPVVFVPVAVLMLFQTLQLGLQAVDPVLGTLVALPVSLLFLVVVPLFQGGLIAMADEALDGATSLGRFVDAGKSNYVSLLVAYLLLVAINSIIFVGGALVAVFGGAALYAGSGA